MSRPGRAPAPDVRGQSDGDDRGAGRWRSQYGPRTHHGSAAHPVAPAHSGGPRFLLRSGAGGRVLPRELMPVRAAFLLLGLIFAAPVWAQEGRLTVTLEAPDAVRPLLERHV